MRSLYYIIFFVFVFLQQTTAQLSIEELDSLAYVASSNNNQPKALRYYNQMLEQIQKKGSAANYLENIKYAAILYLEMGRYEEAEELYQQIISIQQKQKKTENLLHIQCLGQLAYCYYGMGSYEDAADYYLKAIEFSKRILEEDAPTYTAILNNLALLYTTIKQYEEAEQLYLQIIAIDRRNVHTKKYYASSLNNLAALYHETKRYSEAQKLYLEAIEILENIYGEDHPTYALGLNNLAALYEQMEDHEAAALMYADARKILGKNSPFYIHSLNSSAKLFFKQEKYPQAKQLWREAMELANGELGVKHPTSAQYLDNLALVYLKSNQLDSAWNYCLAGIAANSPDLDTLVDWSTLGLFNYSSIERTSESLVTLLLISKAMYEDYKSEENLRRVYELSKIGMQLNERIRNDFSSSKNKLHALSQNNKFVSSGLQAVSDLNDKTLYPAAFAFAEQNKSMLLLDAIKGQRARELGDLPDSLALVELNLHHQQENLKQEQLKAIGSADKARLASSMNALHLEIDAFVKSLKNKYPQYHALKYEHLVTKAASIQALLDDKTLLLEYFVDKDKTFLFVVSQKEIEMIPILISKNKLSAQIAILRDALSNYEMLVTAPEEAYIAYTKSADWLYKEILKKALENKTEKRLIIITDGELGHLPFEVFLTKEAPQTPSPYSSLPYLVKDYSISYNYAASLWKENCEATKKTASKTKKQELLAFAASYTKQHQNLLSLRSPQLFKLRNSLETLPAAEDEVKTLSKAFYGNFLTGLEASEAAFKKLAPSYSVIHLAMHGVLNEEHPALSSLAFTENFDKTEDNFLQAYEISQLQLNADLVVLSACQTGYGQFEQGEGVMSLARSFMYAGVPSLVVSLWQVNDQATAVIMSFFYQNLSKNMPKDEALRQAKLHYLESYEGSITHPALWSAFIQVGDSSPIFLKTKNSWFWPLLGIGGVVLLIVGIYRWRKKP